MDERQTINDIMKTHEPWTIGVSTREHAKNLFYPVKYNKNKKKWFGYYKYKGPDWSDNIIAVRFGYIKKYYIYDTERKPLPKSEEEIHAFIESF